MKRLLSVGLLLVIWAVVLAVIWLRPPQAPLPFPAAVFPPAAPPSGAALFYNKAFEALPVLNDEERKSLTLKPSQPLDRALAPKLVERFGPALELLARGAKEPACEWGVDLNAGFSVPHVSKAMQCIRALALRARLRLENGNPAAAVDDLLVGFRLSRQLGEPPLVICTLVRMASERLLLAAAARDLPKFDAAALRRLADGLAVLPPAHSMAESIALEKRMLPMSTYCFVKELRSNAARAPWYERLGYEFKNMIAPSPYFSVLRASPEILAAWTHAMEADYDALERAMRLPYGQGRPQIDALMQKVKTGTNPLSEATLSSFSNTREKEVLSETLWTVFQTVLDARLHHTGDARARIAALSDPLDGLPLECHDVEGGVEIRLLRPNSQTPVTLTVGLEEPPHPEGK